MPAIEDIAEPQIRENITRAAADVFKTMLRRPAKLVATPFESDAVHPWPAPSMTHGVTQVVGIVGFIGEANGFVYLWFNLDFAKKCTGAMLGLDSSDLAGMGDEPVNDAIGELANMVVGSFKNGLCDAGYPCKLTIPTVLRGTECALAPTHLARRFAYTFESSSDRLAVDVVVKASS